MVGIRPLVATSLLAIWLVGIGVALAGPSIPPGWRFTFPAGDAREGEKAFVKMKCHTCHEVSGRHFDAEAEPAGNSGPELTRAHARLTREYLAESILNTSQFLAHGNYKMTYRAEDGTSKMASYHETMSVKELIDIVEFMRTTR